MTRVTISLPELMNDYIGSQVKSGQYGNISEYVRNLIRKDQEEKKLAIKELRALLEEGIKSGISKRTPEDVIKSARQKLGLKVSS